MTNYSIGDVVNKKQNKPIMPPKAKRGRPFGSKNKKELAVIQMYIKSENAKQIRPIYEDNQVIKDLSDLIELQDKLFHCKRCPNKNFKLKENFEKHLLLEHSTSPDSVECKECHVVCPNQEILDIHVQKAHVKEYSCEFCGKEFARQAHVVRHMTQKGCGKTEAANFPCEICSATFTRKDNLLVHLRTLHIRSKSHRCKQCSFTTKNFTKLIRHWHAHHSDSPGTYICDLCGKTTTSRTAMTKHFEIHGEKKYECEVCKYTTHTVEVMRRHVLTHVSDKPYKCSTCSMSFIQRSQLQRHALKHIGLNCPLCNEFVQTKKGLLKHLKGHSVVDYCPFPNCRKKKLSPFKFESHLTSHLDPKTYPCEVCKKTFQSEVNMRRHLSTHTLDKPRRCMYCVSARAYVRGQQLVRHVRRYHHQVFKTHLAHVRSVLDVAVESDRVTKSEMECILNVLDAESERILEGYSGAGVLYGGMQEVDAPHQSEDENSPLMSEKNLADHMTQLLEQLIDKETLECFGWPDETVDVVLEKLIEQCGAKAADRDKWTRVQCLRENAKQLFLYVVDDKNVAKMLDTHTIDQIIKHILAKVTEMDD